MGTAWRPLFFDGDRFCFILLGVSVPGRLAVFLHVFARPSASGLHTAKANNVISKDYHHRQGPTTHRVPSLSSLLGIRGQFEFLHSSLPSFICFFAHLYPHTSVSQLFCSFNHLFIYPSVQSTGERLNRRTIQASFGSIVLLFNRSFIQSFFR